MKRKNVIVFLSAIVAASMLLVACGGGTQPVAPATTAPDSGQPTTIPPAATQEQPAAGAKAKVVIFIGMGTGTDPEQITKQEALAKRFNETHDKIEIEFMIVPTEEAYDRYLAMVAGNNAPQLVGPNGVNTVAEFLDTWEDITPYIQKDNYDLSDFYGPAVVLNQYPGKNVGLPLGLYPGFIYYNKDIYDAGGVAYPPHDYNDKAWTYAKLREDAMLLTLDKNGKNATEAGFDPANIVQYGYDDSWATFRGMMVGWGAPNVGRPTTEDYKTALVNSPEWITGAQWYSDGIWKDYFIPDSAAVTARDANAADPFGSGIQAMFASFTWFMAEGLADLPFKYDIAPMPFNDKGTRISRINSDIFTIPASAKNKQEAWEVMKWLVSPENIIEVCQIYGCLPPRKSVETQFRSLLKETYPQLDLDVIYNAITYLDAPNHEGYVPDIAKVEEALTNALSRINTGEEKDAKKVLDDVNAEVQKILDEYWATH